MIGESDDQAAFEVAVVIPLFNKRPFIRSTLEAVLQQCHPASEIVVVDDGSTDGGPTAIADLIGGPVRLIRQPNQGPGLARNRGAEAVVAEWIAFLDGDDLWRPDHLATLRDMAMKFPSADVLVTNHDRAMHGDPVDLTVQQPCEANPRILDFMRDPISHARVNSSVIAIRRSIFVKTCGFPDFVPGEDTDFWFRLGLDWRFAISDRATVIIVRKTEGIMDVHESQEKLGFQLQQLFATIDLAMAKRPAQRCSIVMYRDAMVRRNLVQALVRGETGVARTLMAQIQHLSARDRVMQFASALPAPVLSLLLKLRVIVRSSGAGR